MKEGEPREAGATIRFGAVLRRRSAAEERGSDAVLVLTGIASADLSSPGGTAVEGTINGFPFRAPLETNGDGAHELRVNEALQAAAGVREEDMVSIEVTRIGNEPECRTPTDLREGLAMVSSALSQWRRITPTARRDWILWISSAKRPETRRQRIEKACSMLAAGKRRVCCFGGLNWLIKDHPNTGGTWLELPN